MNPKRDRACMLLVALLLVFVLLATWYSITIPLGEAPDEVPHFTYVRYLAQHGRLPSTTEEHEAFQPPLYYALGALATFWIEDLPDAPFAVRANAYFDVVDPRAPKNLLLHTADEAWPYRGWALAWHLVRLCSILLGAITVWAVYQLGRVVFADRKAIGLTMAALVAFTPQFLFLSAVVNNDNAATTFAALTLWQTAALLHHREKRHLWRHCLLLGLFLGLGLLSKASLIALLPVVGLAILIAVARHSSQPGQWIRYPLKLAILCALLTFGLVALISGWYFIRNWLLYGDPMGWSFLLQINARREGPLTAEVLVWLFKGIFRSFWLGWIGIEFEPPIYGLIGAACLVGVAGFVMWLVQQWRALNISTRWTLVLLGLHAAITMASLIQWTATVLGTDQGRLIFPLLPSIMLLLATGWGLGLGPRGRTRHWVLGGLVGALLLLAVLTPLRYIGPVHAPAPVATQEDLAAANPQDVAWDGVRLLGYRLEDTTVEPGDTLVLYLYWQAQDRIDRDLLSLIQLVDQDGAFLMYKDGSPTAGRDTTDRWTPGVPLASLHLLPVPEYGQQGEYRLTLSMHPFGQPSWIPVVGPDGALLGDHHTLPETIRIVSP